MTNVIVGEKYFKYLNNEEFETIIIKSIRESYVVVIKNEDTTTISYDELKEYTLLKSNGYLFFTVAKMKESKDVVVYLVRNEDIQTEQGEPYCACRQNITDVFTERIKQNDDNIYLGLSMSKDSCPADLNFKMILGCDDVEYVEKISYYIEDSLKHILSLLEKKYLFNSILSGIYKSLPKHMIGVNKTLKELLIDNEFMRDVHYGYNIHDIPFKIELSNEVSLLTEQKLYLENELKHEMFQTYVMEYDRTVDLNKIQRNHILVWDSDDKLYIIGYDEGKYINPAIKDQFKDMKDRVGIMKDYLRKVKGE